MSSGPQPFAPRFTLVLLAAGSSMVTAAAADAAPQVVFTEATSTSAEAIVGLPGVTISFTVVGSDKAVLDALWDEDNFAETFPSITRAKLLRDQGHRKELECTEEFLSFEASDVMVITRSENGTIRFREKEGSDTVFRGTLSAQPAAGRRAAVRVATFGESPWFIPDAVVKSALEDMGPQIAERTQAVVKRHAAAKKVPTRASPPRSPPTGP